MTEKYTSVNLSLPVEPFNCKWLFQKLSLNKNVLGSSKDRALQGIFNNRVFSEKLSSQSYSRLSRGSVRFFSVTLPSTVSEPVDGSISLRVNLQQRISVHCSEWISAEILLSILCAILGFKCILTRKIWPICFNLNKKVANLEDVTMVIVCFWTCNMAVWYSFEYHGT